MKIRFLPILLFFVPSVQAGFFVGPGGTDASFLEVPLQARTAALAGAGTTLLSDVTAVDANPAGIAGLQRTAFSLSYMDHFEDTSFQSLVVGLPYDFSGKQKITQEQRQKRTFYFAAQYKSFDAEDDARNELGVKTNSFELKDELFALTAAHQPGKTFSYGLTGKLIKREIQEDSATNFAFDLGAHYLASANWTLGISALNIGPSQEVKNESNPLPMEFRVGSGYEYRQFLFLTDLSLGRDDILQPAGGVEWAVARFVDIRLGVLYHTTLEFSTGLGLKITPSSSNTELGLDYGVQTTNELGVSHTVTLRILL